MACLTPEHALSGECGFLAANLYARSIFGEDVLANICLEKQVIDGGGGAGGRLSVTATEGGGVGTVEHITGHIRIRSKTQGIALSLGDKVRVRSGKV